MDGQAVGRERALDVPLGLAEVRGELDRALGVDAEAAAAAERAPADAAHGRAGALAAEPAVARAERAGADDLALGRDPLHAEHVLGVAAHVVGVGAGAVVGAGAGDDGAGAADAGDVEVEAQREDLRLELGRDHVGLDDGVHVLLVDLDDGVHAAHVELERRVLVLDGTGPVVPAGPVRLDLEAVLVGQADDRLDLLGRAGQHDGGRTRHVVALVRPHELGQPLEGVAVEDRRRHARRCRRRRCPRARGRPRRGSAASCAAVSAGVVGLA